MTEQGKIEIYPVRGIQIIKPGDDIASILCTTLQKQGLRLLQDDIIVVAQCIVSKAEGSIVSLKDIKPSPKAHLIAMQTGKEPELVEIILRESTDTIRVRGPHIITRTKHGWICANSGVDISNVSGGNNATTLPRDSDASAEYLRRRIKEITHQRVAVIISDTFGRPLRKGQVNVGIGIAGMKPILDRKGEEDLFKYPLKVKEIAVADELASAAELVIGQAKEGIPIAVIRGYAYESTEETTIKDLIRPLEQELFL